MFHLERHPWRKLVVISGCFLLAGCATTRDKPASLAPPGLGGESPSHFGDGEGIGGGRAARRPAFSALEKKSASADDEFASKDAEKDPGVMRTSYFNGGGLSALFTMGGCG